MHFPIDFGNSAIWLSVKINHLSFFGKASSGMLLIWFDLKPIMLNSGQSASTFGNSVKALFPKNRILSLINLPKSAGKSLILLLDKSRTSMVSHQSNNTLGKAVNPSAILICFTSESE